MILPPWLSTATELGRGAANVPDRDLNRLMRDAIDAAGKPVTVDVHTRELASIADDAMTIGAARSAVETLAQIPIVRIGRATYRVFAERRTYQSYTPIGGAHLRMSYLGEIGVVCRTRPSSLHQHATADCACRICRHARTVVPPGTPPPDVWHHQATGRWLYRHADGTFTCLPKDHYEHAAKTRYGDNS